MSESCVWFCWPGWSSADLGKSCFCIFDQLVVAKGKQLAGWDSGNDCSRDLGRPSREKVGMWKDFEAYVQNLKVIILLPIHYIRPQTNWNLTGEEIAPPPDGNCCSITLQKAVNAWREMRAAILLQMTYRFLESVDLSVVYAHQMPCSIVTTV